MTSNIANLLVALFQEYGFDVAELGLIVFCFWKLGTNHLSHLKDGIDKANEKIDTLDIKTTAIEDEMKELNGRVSHIEGKLNIDK